jgi:hypothetical protein
MVELQQRYDTFGNPLFAGYPVSDTVNAMVFTEAGVKTQAIPSGAKWVRLAVSDGLDNFVKFGSEASAPGEDVTDGSASELASELRQIGDATTISVAVGGAGIVTLSYYS